jgi:histidine ammonia-lyase
MGFGLFANQSIPADRLGELQRNLILWRSCGLEARLFGRAAPSHRCIAGIAGPLV